MSFLNKTKIFTLGTLFLAVVVTGVLAPVTLQMTGQGVSMVSSEVYAETGLSGESIAGVGMDPRGWAETVLASIMIAVMGFFGVLVWASGLLLNYVSVITVVQMGTIVGQLGAVQAGWATFRDLANLMLIFILLFIGIATILRLSGYGMKDLLKNVIIVALLINFSLFFTNVVIDTSNLIATQFYNKITTAKGVQPSGPTDLLESKVGIGTRYMNALSLTSIYGFDFSKGGVTVAPNNLDFGNIFTIGLMGSLLFIVTAAVFFAAALILIARFVALIFIMILAPLAFVAMVLPKTGQYASKWWTALISNAIYAPVFFMLTWFVIRVVESDSFRTAIGFQKDTTPTFSGIGAGSPDSMIILVNFIIIMGFVIASLTISKSIGVLGGSTVVGWANNARKVGQGVLYRNTAQPIFRGAKHAGQRAVGAIERSGNKSIQKVISAIPFARSAMQGASVGLRSDVTKRQAEVSSLRTGEMVRRLNGPQLPTSRAAMVSEIAKREDLSDLSVEEVTKGRSHLAAAGMSTVKLDQMRPDAHPDYDSIVKATAKQGKASDVSKLHPVIVSGENKDDVSRAMVETYDGGMMAAVARRGDALSSAYMKTLFKLAGTDETERSSRKIVKMLNETGKDNKKKAENAEQEGKKQLQEFYEKISARNYAAASDIVRAPARRLMNLDPNGNERQTSPDLSPHETAGNERFAKNLRREAREWQHQRDSKANRTRKENDYPDEEDGN